MRGKFGGDRLERKCDDKLIIDAVIFFPGLRFSDILNGNKKSSRKMRGGFLLSKQACKPNSVP